ncbi:MAG: YbgC/FadM family acyl-CoA thioesterase [Planctomycetes bacterium]|nr:YbgC/FadM family acyl-CoA thioesterase [Planctomycetota bacterium]
MRITLQQRVRYVECDPMGFVHHSIYPIWFEMARTELLRQSGISYAQLEATGTLIVVVKLEVKYRKPAKYDDVLDITAICTRAAGARIEHSYEIRRGDELLVVGSTVLACIDRAGKVQPVPEHLHYEP